MSTKLNPYLNFNGNASEAMSFYKEVFEAEIDIMTFRESPMEVDEEYMDKIMHSTIKFGDNILMASDAIPGNEAKFGNSVTISLNEDNQDRAQDIFNKLSEGGSVMVAFEKQFWGSKFGMFQDKFGINWMVNCEMP